MKHKKLILLIDGNNLLHRMFWQPQLKQLRRKDGKKSGAFYGFITNLHKLIQKFQPLRVIVCWDSSTATETKSQQYEGYKSNRKKRKKSLTRQQADIVQFIQSCGILNSSLEGVEADLLIYHFAILAKNEKYKVIVISADHDLLQCIDKGSVVMYDDQRRKLWTDKEVMERYKIHANQIGLFKALSGDKSDNVKGVNGFGPVKAREIIRSCSNKKEIEQLLSAKQLKEFRSSLEMVQLQLSFGSDIQVHTVNQFVLDNKMLMLRSPKRSKELLEKYSCSSLLRKFDQWIQVFDLTKGK